jgi:type VI secretion system protein ImpA
MSDLNAMPEPSDGEDPCGPQVEDDPDFFAMEQLARGIPEQRMGYAVQRGVSADWTRVEALAVGLLGRSKDWRVVAYLLRSALYLRGLGGLARGLQVAGDLVSRFGRDMHPRHDDYREPLLKLFVDGDGGLVSEIKALGSGIQVDDLQSCLTAAREADRRFQAHYLDGPFSALCSELETLRKTASRPPGNDFAVIDPTPYAATGGDAAARADPGSPAHLERPSADARTRGRTPDLDELLSPISADDSCGPNLELDPAFGNFERALARKPERWFGSTIEPAEEPEWALADLLAVELFSRTKDLRIGVGWTRALTRLEGLAGAALGLQLIDQLLQRWWMELHPRFDVDEDDLVYRLNTLGTLNSPRGLLGDLRALPIGGEASGVTGGSIERTVANHSTASDQELILQRRALKAEIERRPRWPQLLLTVQAALAGICDTLSFHGQYPDLRDVQRFADLLAMALHRSDFNPTEDTVVIGPSAAIDGAEAESGPPIPEVNQALLETRNQLLLDIFAVVDGAKIDAGHACRRAHRLTATSFLELVRELTPAHDKEAEVFLRGDHG